MATFSFNYILETVETEARLPATGYTIILEGDVGKPTRFEIDSVMDNTARAALKLATSPAQQNLKFEIDEKRGKLDDLRSKHYIWNVKRNDGNPMQQHELQLAFLMYAMERNREPVFSIPRSTLQQLLMVEKSHSQALVTGLYDAAPLQREVHIADGRTAACLVELGIISPADSPDQYVLMDIKVG